ncbi:MAG: energy-coupling factor ABC transporter ATP-binding protein [Saccharofermentans sp.]|nr:energy-coupling factor ABC transporter ATP-binding protein [Saccharofermentans sp.]
MIKIENLTYQYSKNGKKVLDDVTFEIKRGETVGLIGANGAGKSTLLKLLVGICDSYEGLLVVDNLKVEKRNYVEIRKKVGYLFQNSDNQLFLSRVRDDVAFGPENYGYSDEEVKSRVEWALSQVDMLDLADKPIHHLSGGQKKRAAIASILSLKPELLLLDEPSVALDPKSRRILIGVLKSIPGTKFIASHDLAMIGELCERVILLDQGKIIKIGAPEEILGDEQLLLNHGL